MDCARASTGVKSRMNNVAAALLHSLQLLRPRLLIIIAVALPGEITFTRGKIGFAEAFNSIVATDNHCSREAQSFFGTRLMIPPNSKEPRTPRARRQRRLRSVSATCRKRQAKPQLCAIIARTK